MFFKERPEGVEKSYSIYVARPDWNENEGFPNNWTAKEVFETANDAGFDRVAVCNTGWNRDGYDAGYPDRLPVNPERGTNADFKAAAEAAQKLSKGFFLNIHDNYIDAYKGEAFKEEEMLQRLPGNPWLAGIWRGGQAHHLCAEVGLKYAKRDLPKINELSGPGCIYIDVSGNTPLYRCWSKDHPLTRREAWLKNRELFEYARSIFGALAVEGCGTDHYADVIDIGAYGGFHGSMPPLADGPMYVPVPLWQSVYHDSVLNYIGEGYMPIHGSEYRLYQALYTFLPTSFDEHSKRLSFELRETYCAELVKFEDIIPRTIHREESGTYRTRGISRSVYANGTEVIANFNDEPFDWNGTTIPPREYVIKK